MLSTSSRRPRAAGTSRGRRAASAAACARVRARFPSIRSNQDLDGLAAHLLDRLLDRRQRRLAERGLGHVVEADHGQVIGHREAQRCARRPSSRAPSRRSRRRSRSAAVRARAAARAGLRRRLDLVPADADERSSTAMPAPREGLAVAALAQIAPTRGRGAPRGTRSGGGRGSSRYSVADDRAVQVVGVDRRQARGARRCGRRRRPASRTSRRRCPA